ncbi:ATP-dependent (S)-NAD(P)H-hydrate dehydratase [Parasteatoda tepidariorum]|uniref:ATP-dependent (S)-NAD(P)H-hydrate dehydratase n=1 Tax=Parasteatoda tepidariorum TaxID=114398 RepID=UPI001C729486|nr:ATP-dependent (S)-NAD(P)H-hydrate dehydratase [Parasteatoda tepidariorum]
MDFKEELLSIIPPLSVDSHKGAAGRIGIVGGSKNYTGAPYYAAISALKVGCDLAHVFCWRDAAQVIKTYSPELIVHPILDSPNFIEEVTDYLPSLHSLVIGPGLGRDKITFDATRSLINLAKKRDMPLVFDADALFYLNENFQDVMSYKKAILTPNKVEFKRLYEAVLKKNLQSDGCKGEVEELSNAMGVTIAKKGPLDIISDGSNTVLCDELGSPRRCGGQGDLLSGSMGVFSYWAHKRYPEAKTHCPTILAALAACILTRRCNHLAFKKFQRSMLTSDMISEIHASFSFFVSKAELV